VRAADVFVLMRRFMRFEADDEAALRRFAVDVAEHIPAMAVLLHDRALEHAAASATVVPPEVREGMRRLGAASITRLLNGPWDESYLAHLAGAAQTMAQSEAPQCISVGTMLLGASELMRLARRLYPGDAGDRVCSAVGKISAIELGVILEIYHEEMVGKIQRLERIEKLHLEQRLAISEARYEEIVEKGEALVVTFDAAGRIGLFNSRCEILTGLGRDQVGGLRWLDLFVPEARRVEVGGMCAAVLAGQRVPPYEGPLLRGDAGRRVRWHLTTLPAAEGPVLCGIGVDVTDEHVLAARTLRAERLAAVGAMATGLAHEVRNPLNAAHLQLTLVNRRLSRAGGPDVEGALEAARLVGGEMRRLAVLVEEFLEFARPRPLRCARLDLRATAEAIVALLGPEATASGITLTLAPGPSVEAEFDDERMKQVLLNLVRNAFEASAVTVEIAVDQRAGDAVVSVVDDGVGLPANAAVFEPFFTTKAGGIGLGLAISHRIIGDHGGEITVNSRPGRTIFEVSLPR
jgi:PAS domain S-box-containing protein